MGMMSVTCLDHALISYNLLASIEAISRDTQPIQQGFKSKINFSGFKA